MHCQAHTHLWPRMMPGPLPLYVRKRTGSPVFSAGRAYFLRSALEGSGIGSLATQQVGPVFCKPAFLCMYG